MFFIPTWISNVLLLVTCWLSGFQLVQLKRANPVMNIQFVMIVFSMLMVLIVALYNRTNPWLSLLFFPDRGRQPDGDDPSAPHAAADETIRVAGHADQFHRRTASRPGYRVLQHRAAHLRALRILHRDLPDVPAAG